MVDLKIIEKKYSLYFPHLPPIVCEKKEETYNIVIFDSEIVIYDLSELEILLNVFITYVETKQNENEISNKQTASNKNFITKSKRESYELKKTFPNSKRPSLEGKKSAKGKMKMKNLQNNKYIPNFTEDDNETRNNILIENKESHNDSINKYCMNNNISFPEYLFEKSNGVYICRAMFMREKFESRYAYDINVAKEDACSLIWSFINYKEENNLS